MFPDPIKLTDMAADLAEQVQRACGKLSSISNLADDMEKINAANPDVMFWVKELRGILE